MSNTGGPAFPHPAGWRRDPEVSDGMTLRDYFAAKAMQCVIMKEIGRSSEDMMALWAYNMAEAMLKARGQE